MEQNKSTQASDKSRMDMVVIEKKRRLPIPKDLNVVACWNIIGPQLAEEFGPDYSHIPYCLDTNAYKIGHIFIPVEEQVKCFRVTEIVKIIGPLYNFAIKSKTNARFLNPKLDPIKRQPDAPNVQLVLNNGKRQLIFTAFNCLFLDRPPDMQTEANVTIDRSSHPDLGEAKRFGLITGVFVAKNFKLNIERGERTRMIYIGEDMHTVLFKYEICEINESGFVTKATKKKADVRWASIMEQPRDSLPLPKLVTITDSR